MILELVEVELGSIEEIYFWFLPGSSRSTTERVEQELQVRSEVGLCLATQPCLGSGLPDQYIPDPLLPI